jgi:hypothetical protein
MLLGFLHGSHCFLRNACLSALDGSERRCCRREVEAGNTAARVEFSSGERAFAIECHSILPRGEVMDQERRRAQRFPFIASAEVFEEKAGTRLAARISDISATGCYVDTINPPRSYTLTRTSGWA